MIDLSAFDLLRSHVARCANESAAARHAHFCGFKRSGETEVRNENLIFFSNKDVVRFEIAMDNAFGVSGVERLAKLARKFETSVERERMFVLENVVKILPIDEGHGNEFDTVGFA